jgi:hypothetical protein
MISISQRIKNVEIKTANPIIFKATSNYNGQFTFIVGNVIRFESLVFCYPEISYYNTETCSYTVPKNEIYQFSYILFSSSTANTYAKIAITKNNIEISVSGGNAANIETSNTLESCMEGDVINVKCIAGSNIVCWMSQSHCSFSGQLIYEI